MQTLILSCNTGAGHNSCAQAVQEAYHSRGEICNITDSLQFISEKASTFISNWHTRIYRHAPRLFDAGYQRAESHEDIFCEGTPIYKLLSSGAERMYQYIRSAGYDNIICTHVFPALALTEMRRQHPCLQLVTSHISTDYTCAPCTADSALDWYFIPSTSLLGEFEQCGLQPQKLIASGIPVRQQFYQRVSQEAGKANAGISPAHQHILMMCGSMGCGPMEEIISYLCPYLTTEQELSVVCGTNDDLRKKLQKRTEKYSQVHVLGTVNNVPQLMQASDLFLTKPGGLSTSEAMAAELPMVLIDAVAGCETHNLNFFLRNGMAVTANTPKAIADTTIKTLNAPVLLSKMRAAMRSQTECTAADKIYVLIGWRELSSQSKRALYAYCKESVADRICHISKLAHDTYAKFLSGQCVEVMILGTLIFLSFSVAGIPYAGLTAVLTAAFAFVPYIGGFLSCAFGILFTLLAAPNKALLCLIVYQATQFVENQFIYPHVVGNSVGLSPFWTLLAVLLGGKLFGVLGMIFFIPLMALVSQLLHESIERRLHTRKPELSNVQSNSDENTDISQ